MSTIRPSQLPPASKGAPEQSAPKGNLGDRLWLAGGYAASYLTGVLVVFQASHAPNGLFFGMDLVAGGLSASGSALGLRDALQGTVDDSDLTRRDRLTFGLVGAAFAGYASYVLGSAAAEAVSRHDPAAAAMLGAAALWECK